MRTAEIISHGSDADYLKPAWSDCDLVAHSRNLSHEAGSDVLQQASMLQVVLQQMVDHEHNVRLTSS